MTAVEKEETDKDKKLVTLNTDKCSKQMEEEKITSGYLRWEEMHPNVMNIA